MKQKEPGPSRYLTPTAVAKLCGMSQATILRAIAGKQLKASTTPGGHFRIAEEDLEKFFRANNIPLPSAKTRSRRVLIVEDNPAELRMFQRTLASEEKLEIKTTHSGFEAGLLLRSFSPDLILLDILIDDLDGREVARLIRSDEGLKHIKIIAITGAQDEKTLLEIKSCGVDDLLLKPIAPSELRAKVKLLSG